MHHWSLTPCLSLVSLFFHSWRKLWRRSLIGVVCRWHPLPWPKSSNFMRPKTLDTPPCWWARQAVLRVLPGGPYRMPWLLCIKKESQAFSRSRLVRIDKKAFLFSFFLIVILLAFLIRKNVLLPDFEVCILNGKILQLLSQDSFFLFSCSYRTGSKHRSD